MSLGTFKNVFINHIYLMYMYKENLALNNLQGLIRHKTERKQTDLLFHFHAYFSCTQFHMCLSI